MLTPLLSPHIPPLPTRPTLSILGSTGSIGMQALRLLQAHPRYRVETLVAGRNAPLLIEQALLFKPRLAVIADPAQLPMLRNALAPHGILSSSDVNAAAALPHDRTLAAISGRAGVAPTLHALEACPSVAIANKETFIYAGHIIREQRARYAAAILPVDSEHAALYALFDFADNAGTQTLILPASGGPFLRTPLHELAQVTPQQAQAHPKWSMGAKISVDSALMLNKVLEVLEAREMFALPSACYDILVHPQAIVHGMIRRSDGSLRMHAAPPDMAGPIASALFAPEPPPLVTPTEHVHLNNLSFEVPDPERFPVLRLLPTLLSGTPQQRIAFADAAEAAVEAFLTGALRFTDIIPHAEAALAAASSVQ